MKMMKLVAAAALACLSIEAAAAPPGPQDRQQLEALAGAADEAWNGKDADRMSSYYAADAHLRLSTMPAPVTGRNAVRAYFEKAFAARPARLRHVTRIDHIEMMGPDLAFSDATVRVEREAGDGKWQLVRAFLNNSIAVRENGRWKLAAVRAHALPDSPTN